MPIIEIQALVDDEPDVEALLRAAAAACADALGIEERYCWAIFRHLASGAYYEGGHIRTSEEAPHASPIVRVSAYRGRPPQAKRRVLAAVAEAVGRGLGVPTHNVFVEYREIPEGHVFTGGKVL